MPCPVCVDKKLVEILVTVGEHDLVLRNCSQCETKWWECDGQQVELHGVLEAAAVR